VGEGKVGPVRSFNSPDKKKIERKNSLSNERKVRLRYKEERLRMNERGEKGEHENRRSTCKHRNAMVSSCSETGGGTSLGMQKGIKD